MSCSWFWLGGKQSDLIIICISENKGEGRQVGRQSGRQEGRSVHPVPGAAWL